MPEDPWDSFKLKLDETHPWPCPYTFKCIVRAEHRAALDGLTARGEHSIRPSSNAKYLSLTLHVQAESSDAVIELYRTAARIPGVILL